MLGDHPTDQFPILLYGADSLLCALTFYMFRSYADRTKLFKKDEIARAQGPKRSIPAIIIYALSIVLAFINVYLSLACFFIVPLLYFVPTMNQDSINKQ
jgi:uncharacterized membrane protein